MNKDQINWGVTYIDILKAISTRRSVGVMKPDPVPNELIHQILEAGTWAPSHFRTEPWRFFVITDDARIQLGKAISAYTAKTLKDANSEESIKRLRREEIKPLRAPVIIAVAVEPTERSKVLIKEEYAAVHAAIQNMLLAAHGLGLGVIWRTGNACYSQEVKTLFGLSSKAEMVGFLYIGYSNMKELKGKRRHWSEVTKWYDRENDLS